jgi:hypothetical protein
LVGPIEPRRERAPGTDDVAQPAGPGLRALRWFSLPTSLLGILLFYAPWVFVSCGRIKGQITGEEFATGAWEEKIGAAGARRLKERLRVDTIRRPFSKDRPGDTGQTILHPEQPALWVIPVAFALLGLVGVISRLPRWLVLVPGAVLAVALGYFKYRFELELANARVPGQVHVQWLYGYWWSWVVLVAATAAGLITARKKRRGSAGGVIPPA